MSRFGLTSADNTPFVLLKEDDYMLRQTFSLHAKDSGLAEVIQASSPYLAKEKCAQIPFNLVILGFHDWEEDMDLIFTIRSNLTACANDIPIIGIVEELTTSHLEKLKSLKITEVLVKPLRIRHMQEAFVRHIHH